MVGYLQDFDFEWTLSPLFCCPVVARGLATAVVCWDHQLNNWWLHPKLFSLWPRFPQTMHHLRPKETNGTNMICVIFAQQCLACVTPEVYTLLTSLS